MSVRALAICNAVSFLLLAACSSVSVCPPDEGTPQTMAASRPVPEPATGNPVSLQVKIGSRLVPVDRIVEGPLCDDVWSGTVYVGCDVLVPAWEEQPTFFEDCTLVIEPGSVVYVADHNNAAYYNGCSCHTGGIAAP